MSNVEKRAFEFRADEDEGQIVGHAAVFSEWYDLGWFEERILPGAFADVLGDDVRFLFNHNPDHILGRSRSGTLLLAEDETGLAVRVVPPDTQLARDLRTLIARGDVSQMSFAFEIKEDSWEHGDDTGQRDRRTIHRIKKLYDVSAVTYPASPNTDIAVRSYQQSRPAPPRTQMRDMEQMRRKFNLDRRRRNYE